MRIIAIDPGIASTGYAIGETNKVLETGVIRTSTKDGDDFARCKKIANKVKDLISKYNVGHMVIEDYKVYGNPITSGGKRHGEKTIKVITYLQILAEQSGVNWEIVNHNSWKAEYRKLWATIVLSGKFKHLEEIHEKLSNKKQDHELDAFKMLLPKIISFMEVVKNVDM